MNDKPHIISAQDNILNLDLIGEVLVSCAKGKTSIDALTASMLAALLANCRNYSTIRDRNDLTDKTTEVVLQYMDAQERKAQQKEDDSISDAADEIINDLRKSGINL